MRTRFGGLAALVMLGITLAPGASQAQTLDSGFEVPPPAVQAPLPFGRPRLEGGGWYIAGEFMYLRTRNPLQYQPVAIRGLRDDDGSIGAVLGLTTVPGRFIGNGNTALDVGQLKSGTDFEGGTNLTFGYRFGDGIALEMRWMHLFERRQSATASILPTPPLTIGFAAENTFLFSPNFNFSLNFFGPGNTTGQGTVLGTIGIWNGASQETIDFLQRFEQWEMTMRVPLTESECWRTYGLFGPRYTWFWERFKWRTIHPELDGTIVAEDIADYTNVVSNRLYGIHFGVGNEWFLGDTPIGAFSMSLDVQGAMFFDFVKGRPKYELSDHSTAASNNRNTFSFVPEAQATFNFWWYPYEGIIVRCGYDGQLFFNTYASRHPIDFDVGRPDPHYDRLIRWVDGFNFGIGFIF
jgi:hypothetical protein